MPASAGPSVWHGCPASANQLSYWQFFIHEKSCFIPTNSLLTLSPLGSAAFKDQLDIYEDETKTED